MILLGAIIGIALVSFLLALRSLKQLQKVEQVKEATDELKKGKVIFQNDSSLSPPDSSSLS